VTLSLELICGAASGVLAGLFGVGGGILLVPAMVIVLGFPQHTAQATSLAAMIPAILVGGRRQFRYGNVHLRSGLIIGVWSLAGVAVGTVCATALPDSALRVLFAGMLVLVAARLAVDARRSRRTTRREAPR
jgi:uncharacterized membrane protein YfcA